jgi:hypothetical protein
MNQVWMKSQIIQIWKNRLKFNNWFPNNGDPNNSNSIFNCQAELIDAILKSKEPTLIFTSKNYASDYKVTLPSIFPLHFPFGRGGIEEMRRTHVSVEECLKHYLKISLPFCRRPCPLCYSGP